MNNDKKNISTSRPCLECGAPIYGRQDKKFCSLSCKNAHNNRAKEGIRRSKRKVMKSIERNYQILDVVLNSGCSTINLQTLREMGFNPYYVTAQAEGEKGHKEFCCYDISYYQSNTKVFNIKKNKEKALSPRKKSLLGQSDMPSEHGSVK